MKDPGLYLIAAAAGTVAVLIVDWFVKAMLRRAGWEERLAAFLSKGVSIFVGLLFLFVLLDSWTYFATTSSEPTAAPEAEIARPADTTAEKVENAVRAAEDAAKAAQQAANEALDAAKSAQDAAKTSQSANEEQSAKAESERRAEETRQAEAAARAEAARQAEAAARAEAARQAEAARRSDEDRKAQRPAPTASATGLAPAPTFSPSFENRAGVPWAFPTSLPDIALPVPTPTPAPTATLAEATFAEPVWNLWTERMGTSFLDPAGRPRFLPAALEPNNEYALVLNLAALSFQSEQQHNLFSHQASPDFEQWLDQWLRRNPNVDTVTLTLVALADSSSFEVVGPRVKEFTLDVRKVRQAMQQGFSVTGSPFDDLRDHEGATPYSFGTQWFRFRTRDRAGKAPIAISIWADRKPVDELTVTLCVNAPGAPACAGSLMTSNKMAGIDLTMRGVYPDLALHLIDAGVGGVVGVLRCNSCGWPDDRYPKWDLMESAKWVSDRIGEITADIGNISKGAPDAAAAIAASGDALYNVIFHTEEEDNEATRAFADFIAFAQQRKKDGKDPPSLFVRIISQLPNLTLAPIGLMRAAAPNAAPVFVGSVADLQTPLEYQDYSQSASCLDRWVLFVPPASGPVDYDAVLDARQPFQDWIGAVKNACGDCVIEDEGAFQRWLEQPNPQESDALVILSHHASNALYFSERADAPRVRASILRRKFERPSFVILDACGTSEPGASEFIRQFNFRGMSSAIATSTKVESELAGKFLAKFMTLLKENSDKPDYTVSRARFDAVTALEPEYGAKALTFILAGNGALRVCAPSARPFAAPVAAPRGIQ